ncbi:related to GNAT family acetyltransferase [Melanopsichium pennsylvanicum]|uniref:Related to GNAT family acetyltransferase n=2 Tax=Melanopsichium pennsylvanicum TaxID=63383 RepID=A0AAJ5C3W9_9BASI|nr:conserved hypothetical protein [Melanopsichium pennsylvanicum 4]SNX82904.1 related to GNAT family acetyltransferase [Melanopsichium pennsylvanicum]
MLSLSEKEALQRLGPQVSVDPAKYPSRVRIPGRYIDLAPLSIEHAEPLFPLIAQPEHERLWDYMLDQPFHGDRSLFDAFISARSGTENSMVFWAIIDKSSPAPTTPKVLGFISYLRINAAHRTIEIGNIMFSHLLQRSRKSSEVVYLMLKHAFEELGYRRVEWKCNNLSSPSKRAALRYGFSYEGLFQKMFIIKQRSRDTAWFSMIDDEWPQRKKALEAWLSEDNFDMETGVQKLTLKQAHEKQGYKVPQTLVARPNPF